MISAKSVMLVSSQLPIRPTDKTIQERDGWYSAHAFERIKIVLRHKFFSLLEGHVPTDEECEALLVVDPTSNKATATRSKKLRPGKHNMAKGALRPEDAAVRICAHSLMFEFCIVLNVSCMFRRQRGYVLRWTGMQKLCRVKEAPNCRIFDVLEASRLVNPKHSAVIGMVVGGCVTRYASQVASEYLKSDSSLCLYRTSIWIMMQLLFVLHELFAVGLSD